MRAKHFLFIAATVLMVSCELIATDIEDKRIPDPIDISSPEPVSQITKVSLNDTQKGYVKEGNKMAFRMLKELYEGKDLVFSPLSLQYALAMTANGASGETQQEILDFLGYGKEGIDTLNAYSKTMLEQLPAVDLGVTLKLTDALLVNEQYPLLPSFGNTVQSNYYAAVENMSFNYPVKVADHINEWASRSTNGFIDKLIAPDDISPLAAAFLMNALYFKSKWAGDENYPMFLKESTINDKFTKADGSSKTVPMMRNMRYHGYAEMDGYTVLALPYAGGKFFMYILLPDKNDLGGMLDKLQDTPWNTILSSFKHDAEVYVKLPKFDIEEKYNLNSSLKALGIKKAFLDGLAEFDSMFDTKETKFSISKVIQKARISVAEWGTEAAAVTVVMMAPTSAGPGQGPEPKRIYFYADHPFAFIIGEATSGTILFEGTYTGK